MNKLSNFISKNSTKILWLGIILYILFFSTVCIIKYQHFLYNSLDLAIYNNALYNTLHGHWFWSSVQGHHYFGDHFEPILVLFLPFYAIYPSPIILLILQTIFLGLTAWVIYKITQTAHENAPWRVPATSIPLFLAILWLINPLVHNINLFEFHAISLAPFFILSAIYFYLKIKNSPQPSKKLFLYFYIFIFLSLLIREDIAFILLMFIPIILIDYYKNKIKINKCLPHPQPLSYPGEGRSRVEKPRFLKKISRFHSDKKFFKLSNYQIIKLLIPLGLLLIAYCSLAFRLIKHFSPSRFSPFLYYYNWLGASATEIIQNLFLKFPLVLKHLITIGNFEMLIGLLLPFLFLPLIKPKYLLLALIPFGQMIMSGAGGGALAWQLHYSALFLPGLAISFIYGYLKLSNYLFKQFNSDALLALTLIAASVFLAFHLGPLPGLKNLSSSADLPIKTELTSQVPPSASVMASYDFLSNLSSRQQIYSWHYYFLGQQQFAGADYILPKDPDYILMDANDLISYDLHLKNLNWAKDYYPAGPARLRELLKNYGAIKAVDTMVLFKKDYRSEIELYSIGKNQETINKEQATILFDDKIKLSNYELRVTSYGLLFSITFESLETIHNVYHLKLTANGQECLLPLAYGLYPASEWEPSQTVTTNYWLNISEPVNLDFDLVELQGGLEIDDLRSTKIVVDREIKLDKKQFNDFGLK